MADVVIGGGVRSAGFKNVAEAVKCECFCDNHNKNLFYSMRGDTAKGDEKKRQNACSKPKWLMSLFHRIQSDHSTPPQH